MEVNTDAAETAEEQQGGGFSDWSDENTNDSNANADDNGNGSDDNSDDQNNLDDVDFNQDSFIEQYKADNPDASEEDIDAAAKEAADKFDTISADDLRIGNDDDNQASANPLQSFVDTVKDIAGDDFDEVDAATVKTPEDAKELVNSIVNKRVEKMKSEAKVNNEFVDGLDEAGKALFNALKTNGLKGVQDYLMPDQRIAALQNLDDDSLIIKSMQNAKDGSGNRIYSDEEITNQLAGMDDSIKEKQAQLVRSQLKAAQDQTRSRKAQEINTDFESRKNAEKTQKTEMAQKIAKVAEGVQDFYGLKVDPQVGQAIAADFAKGNYDHLLKNPDFLLKAILNEKIGQRAFRRHGKAKFEEGRLKRNSSDHNADLLDGIGNGGSGGSQRQGQDGFKGWGS